MLNEKPNDGLNWKDKLEDLDSLPEESFPGKTEAWEKLHLRLRGSKRRRKAAWFWIAAACVGIFILLSPWDKLTEENSFVKTNTATGQNKKSMANTSPVILKEGGTNVPDVPVKIRPVKTIFQKVQAVHSASVTDKNNLPGLSINASSSEPGADLPVNATAPIDTVVINRTPLLAKKKLRVIHINELGMPVEEDTREEKYAERPSYYKRLTNSNQDAFSNISINSHAISNDLFKTKISPQN